jgi:hypothetical protein
VHQLGGYKTWGKTDGLANHPEDRHKLLQEADAVISVIETIQRALNPGSDGTAGHPHHWHRRRPCSDGYW